MKMLDSRISTVFQGHVQTMLMHMTRILRSQHRAILPPTFEKGLPICILYVSLSFVENSFDPGYLISFVLTYGL